AAAAGDSMAWPSMSFQYRRSAVPRFLKGMKVIHRAQGGWGVGHILAVSDDPPRLSAEFPGRPGGPVMLSSRDIALARYRFAPESPVLFADGSAARVLRTLPGPADDLYRYTVDIPGKKPQIRSEADLRAPVPREGPAEQLASGRWGAPENFHLRSETVRLDLERRADALGALFASRVYVKPHHVSVAHQVLSAPQPRFVLADEVGLGKTIEAGLVLSGLLHAGLVKRRVVGVRADEVLHGRPGPVGSALLVAATLLLVLSVAIAALVRVAIAAPVPAMMSMRFGVAREVVLSAEVVLLLSGLGAVVE